MRRQPVQVVQVVDADAPIQARAEALGGLGGVLGDVPGHLLSREVSRLAVGLGDVVDELLAPAGIPLRPTIRQGRARHPNQRNSLPQSVLEQGGGERLRWWGQAAGAAAVGGPVQADDCVEVDRPPALELGNLGIADPDDLPQGGLLQADQAGQGPVEGDGGSPPEFGRQGVPQHLRRGVIA
jgi:hypothetical protein